MSEMMTERLKDTQPDFQKAIKKKFGRKRYLASRYIPRYPMSAEREYRRVGRRYVNSVYGSIKKYITELEKEDFDSGYHADAKPRFRSKREIAKDMEHDFQSALNKMDVDKDVDRISNFTRMQTLRQWGKSVQRTFGKEIDFKHYKDLCENKRSEWAYRGKAKLNGVFNWFKEKIIKTVGDAMDIGREVAEMVRKLIRDFLSTMDRITADAIGKLNEMLSELINLDSGCSKYIWKTMGDEKVRECHASFNGKIFEWNNPPEIWYPSAHGRVYTGRFCNVGQDYNCRCTAQPIFEIKTLNIKFTV